MSKFTTTSSTECDRDLTETSSISAFMSILILGRLLCDEELFDQDDEEDDEDSGLTSGFDFLVNLISFPIVLNPNFFFFFFSDLMEEPLLSDDEEDEDDELLLDKLLLDLSDRSSFIPPDCLERVDFIEVLELLLEEDFFEIFFDEELDEEEELELEVFRLM